MLFVNLCLEHLQFLIAMVDAHELMFYLLSLFDELFHMLAVVFSLKRIERVETVVDGIEC